MKVDALTYWWKKGTLAELKLKKWEKFGQTILEHFDSIKNPTGMDEKLSVDFIELQEDLKKLCQ